MTLAFLTVKMFCGLNSKEIKNFGSQEKCCAKDIKMYAVKAMYHLAFSYSIGKTGRLQCSGLERT